MTRSSHFIAHFVCQNFYKNKLERHLSRIHEGKKQDIEDTSQISNSSSSMTYDTLDIAVHEEKMPTEVPEIQETNNSDPQWMKNK